MKDIIRQLKKYHTNKQVYNIMKERGYQISLSLIEKTKVNNRSIKNICKRCGKTFYYMRYKKICVECSGYYGATKNDKQKIKELKHKQLREKFIKETQRITGLSLQEIKKLNKIYSQTEIREIYKRNK